MGYLDYDCKIMNNNKSMNRAEAFIAVIMRSGGAALPAICLSLAASGQATSPAIKLRTIAEVEIKTLESGREFVRLAPADHVVPGDQVLYTLEIRNSGPTAVVAPTVTNPIPAHMAYIADSATGPGAEVSYSVDGGRTFERPENLRVSGPDGRSQVAKATDYTDIRWELKKTLKSKSVAFARFRAVVR